MSNQASSAPSELTSKEHLEIPNVSAESRLASDQRAHLYLELYKQQMAYFHETRRIEFQAHLGLWTAIFLVGYALAGKLQPSVFQCLGFVAATVMLSGVWAKFLQKTKNFDKTLFVAYRARIERLLEAEPLRPKTPVPAGEHAWWLFYVFATLVFSGGVALFLHIIPVAAPAVVQR